MDTMRIAAVIARKELATAFRQRSVLFLGVTVAALFLAAAGLAAHRTKRLADERQAYQTLARRQWEAQPDRHPHRVAHFGSFAFRRVGPLAAFDPGIDSFAGTTVYQEAHRQNTANFSEANHASTMLRFGELSPAMVLQVLVPLLLAFIGFATVAGEREAGTLALLRAQGVSMRALLVGKVLGLVGILALVLLPAGLLAAVAILSASTADFGVAFLAPRLGLLALTYALYFLVWAAAIVMISARARTSRGALAFGAAVWVVTTVVLPRVGAVIARATHPAPARAEVDAAIAAEIRRAADPHNERDPKFAAFKRETLARYGVNRVEDLPVNWGGLVMTASEEMTSEIYERRFQAVGAIHAQQDRLLSLLGALSPVIAVRRLSMAIAGTGPDDWRAFLAEAERHRRDFVQRLNHLHATQIRYQNDRAQRVSRRHWAAIPAFEGRLIDLRAALAGSAVAAAVLLLWLLLGGALWWKYAGRRSAFP
jgi:ABC-2 type transport system permease protein